MKGLEKQFHRKELVVTNANGWCAFFHLLHCYLQKETYREGEKNCDFTSLKVEFVGSSPSLPACCLSPQHGIKLFVPR